MKGTSRFFCEPVTRNSQNMVDLHGASEEKAKERVNWHLQMAEQMNAKSFRFVTGRGNHVNRRGERGTLHREFPNWLSKENSEKIQEIKKCDGYYEVRIKPSPDKKPFPVALEDINQQWLADHIETIKKLAAEGNDFYQNLLGDCHYNGIVVPQDYKAAAKWYDDAHQQGNYFATYALGGCYWQGKGVRQNDDRAIELFKEAAEENFPWAHHQLGDVHEYGDGVPQNSATALIHYERAANAGIDLAKRKTAHAYFWGKGTPPDQKKAFGLYKEVADRGDPHSAYNVATAALNGSGTNRNPALAFQYAKQSADGKDPDGQYLLSELYRTGLGTGKLPNPEESFRHLKLAADNHHKLALFLMSFHSSVSRNRTEKNNYLIRAAKAGQIVAQAMVLEMLPTNLLTVADRKTIEDDFWKQDDEEVEDIPFEQFRLVVIDAYVRSEALTKKRKQKIVRILNTLVQKEDPHAMARLGWLHHEGTLVPLNLKMTETLWLRGEALENAACSCSLGYFYEEQAQHDKDAYKEAFKHFKKGADGSDPNSHNQLGIYYEKGRGVDIDIGEAIKHFEQAMKLDSEKEKYKQISGLFYVPTFPAAALNLGKLYFKQGQMQKAIGLLITAARAGEPSATPLLTMLGVTPEIIALSASATTSTTPTPQSILDDISHLLSLEHPWEITKKNNAWCDLPDDKVKAIEQYPIHPMMIRKTKEGRKILLIENVSLKTLEQIYSNLNTALNNTAPVSTK